MVRRKEFRTILDADVATLRNFIKQEQEKRREFSKHVHTYLPSQFCPQLRDQAPELVLEGTSSDYSFADVRDSVQNYESLTSPFQSRQTNQDAVSPNNPGSGAQAAGEATGDNRELRNEVQALGSELDLRQEEFSSNIREKESMIQKLQIQLQVKEDQLKQLNRGRDQQEAEATKAKADLEEANRTIRELSAQFIKDQKLDRQTIARKTKELETVLREKKCTGILCVEDIRIKPGPAGFDVAQL